MADDPNERRQIADILLTSRRNNEELEVTGALLVTDRNFAQVLEGEREAVEATYERIAHDKRHKDIVLLSMNRSRCGGFRTGRWPISGRRNRPSRPWPASRSKVPACKTDQAARALVTSMSHMLAEQSRADALVPAAE